MNIFDNVRRRLGIRLFLSYLVIIFVGVISLIIAAQLATPGALAGHARRMEQVLPMMVDSQALVVDLNESFVEAVNQILLVSAAAALLTALLVSTFVTRRLIRPIQRMQRASRRIAAGEYEERVAVTGEDELAALAHSFNRMAEQLAETEARRRALVGDVAHELRTPLANVRGVMEGLVDGVLEPVPATFHQVQREVTRLQRLVQDLEALSRAEAGQLLLERELTSPAAFIKDAVSRLRAQFQEKGVELVVELPNQLPAVLVDCWRMTQVVLNLLGNALQYTPEGGKAIVTAEVMGGELIVRVTDTGIGLAAEDLDPIFERFYRVDKSRSRAGGGSGIGLTIVRHLVTAHGGRVWAESPGPSQGSTFTFTLPLAP